MITSYEKRIKQIITWINASQPYPKILNGYIKVESYKPDKKKLFRFFLSRGTVMILLSDYMPSKEAHYWLMGFHEAIYQINKNNHK